MVSASSDAIITTSAEGCIQSFNPGAEAIFGIGHKAIEGKSIELLIPERYRASNARQRSAMAQDTSASHFVKLRLVKGLRADGHEIDLEGQICQIEVDGQQILVGTFRDVTQRMGSEERRKVEQVQLAELTRKLMSNEQALVSRVAHAMQEQLGQTLVAIQITHDAMGALGLGVEPQQLVRLNQRLGTLIQQGIRQVRQVVVELCPPLLGESGLESALDNELRKHKLVQSNRHFALHVQPGLNGLRWPHDVEYAAFMIAREAIGNALRDASTRCLSLRLCGDTEVLRMDIVDDGAGIPMDALWEEGHLGLAAMRERANSIGAVLLVGPGDGGGTRVGLRWQAQL
jgi:PAS domain S-box-containing protein